jgi:hypothetical protein
MMASASKNRIQAEYHTIDELPLGNPARSPMAGADMPRNNENTKELMPSEINGTLKCCPGVPISLVDEYLKYADSIPYPYTIFRKAMKE